MDKRTLLERLDAWHGKLAAESAEVEAETRDVVLEWQKTPDSEPYLQQWLVDKLSELGRTLVATERNRRAVLRCTRRS